MCGGGGGGAPVLHRHKKKNKRERREIFNTCLYTTIILIFLRFSLLSRLVLPTMYYIHLNRYIVGRGSILRCY